MENFQTLFSALMLHFSQNAVAYALAAGLNFILYTKNTQKSMIFPRFKFI